MRPSADLTRRFPRRLQSKKSSHAVHACVICRFAIRLTARASRFRTRTVSATKDTHASQAGSRTRFVQNRTTLDAAHRSRRLAARQSTHASQAAERCLFVRCIKARRTAAFLLDLSSSRDVQVNHAVDSRRFLSLFRAWPARARPWRCFRAEYSHMEKAQARSRWVRRANARLSKARVRLRCAKESSHAAKAFAMELLESLLRLMCTRCRCRRVVRTYSDQEANAAAIRALDILARARERMWRWDACCDRYSSQP
mmetsp:Transcript_6655/g.17448  ORF Transcript_6655/g.17448 Transcript_6655/m.17448 type:complete len:255 (+) Transcript_6655:134-898(+)